MSNNYTYSVDAEIWLDEGDIEPCIFERVELEDENRKPPYEVSIYRGKKDKLLASRFAPDVADHMMDHAFDTVGEHADGWLDGDDAKSLQRKVEKAIDEWCCMHNKQPTFYLVHDVEKVTALVTKITEDDIEYTIVDKLTE